MTTYLVVNDNVSNMDLLNEYYAAAPATLVGHPVTTVAVSHAAETLEGTPASSRVVIMGFPDRDALMAWYNSDAYQAIIAKRHGATEGFAVIVEGV